MSESTVATPYTPLPSNDTSATRLVKVLPAGFDDPIHCELETISLANKPPYIALSYVWGDSRDTLPISLDGARHSATRNLESFLRHLQAILKETFLVLQCLPVHDWPSGLQIIEAHNSLSPHQQKYRKLDETSEDAVLSYFASIDDHESMRKIRSGTSRSVQITQWNDLSLPRFWIDALCINQNDLDERNKQVKRMNHIYRQTDLLFVWGWDRHQINPLAVLVFNNIENLCRDLARLHPERPPVTYESDITDAMRVLLAGQGRVDVLLVSTIGALFQFEWFYRAWVFQEVALSASKPSELWVGFEHISLSKLLVVGIATLEASAKLHPEDEEIRGACESKANRTLLALRMDKNLVDMGQDSLHSISSASNLSICRRLIYILSAGHLSFKVTDPRDAIYSLYGLLSTDQLPAMIEPDYTKPVSVVYHSIASFLLSHMGIDILGFFLSSLGGMHNCPSWVPDFSCLQHYDTLYQQYPAGGNMYKHRVSDGLLSIEERPPQDLTTGHTLELTSSLLGISCPIYWLQTVVSVISLEVDREDIWYELHNNDYGGLLKKRPLMKALSISVLDSIHGAIQRDKEDHFRVYMLFLEWFAGQVLFNPWAQVILLEDIIDVLVGSRFTQMVNAVLHGCLGITRDGHLILGRRLNCLKAGDRIGFIPNSLETFIFRPCDSGYQFITNCWQSDNPELIEVEHLQPFDKEIVTIV